MAEADGRPGATGSGTREWSVVGPPRTLPPGAPGNAPGSAYLLVFDGDSSRIHELPPNGLVIIGRDATSGIVLADETVSRSHAKVTVVGGDAQIEDLDSRNGTSINGERITGARLLVSGDTIGICGATLTFHSRVRVEPPRTLLDLGQFRQRADAELERALTYRRPLTLLVAELKAADRIRVTGQLGMTLRLMDIAAWVGAAQLIVLLPEVGSADAAAAASRLITALAPVAPAARIGIATCPDNGCELGTLLSSARAAAQRAGDTTVTTAAESFTTIRVGDRRVIVADPAMVRLYALLERLAASDLAVLVHGDTGTGKELCAAAVHHWSLRRRAPFVTLNCAAIQENLVESELFGHERGAFSGAVTQKPGLLETAAGGTVFLDEIGELPLGVQAKLLRVLETRRMIRLGDVREREIDVRFVAATNRRLHEEVTAGRFREDLYYRLSGATVWLPPLRDRQREIPLLAQTFLDAACEKTRRPPIHLAPETLQLLCTYAWPGNVRELKNVMEYATATTTENALRPADLASKLGGASPPSGSVRAVSVPAAEETAAAPAPASAVVFRPIAEEMEELVRGRIAAALAATGGNRTRAAELIHMPLRTFLAKVKQYDLGRIPRS
jgi:two-component system, NtrC family, response regulator AtoC